jgi:hypothetical protein
VSCRRLSPQGGPQPFDPWLTARITSNPSQPKPFTVSFGCFAKNPGFYKINPSSTFIHK